MDAIELKHAGVHPRELTIREAAIELAEGRLTAVELLTSCVDRIDELNGVFTAFLHVRSRSDLMEDARASDGRRKKGVSLGPLDGIPIGLKALYNYPGLPTSAGSKILSDWFPQTESSVVTNLREAGAVILGMLNMHEFADGPTNENPHYGSPRNPYGATRIPGGSSGGSAVALATYMCLGATGSDTGGSIRIPAAFCGVVGLKPTFGLVSLDGVVPFSKSLDHAGPMARTAGDALTLLHGMTGTPAPRETAPRAVSNRAIRIGVEQSYFLRSMQPRVRHAFNDAIATLDAAGYEICDVKWPSVAKAGAAELAILFPEAAAVHHRFLKTRLADYGSDVRRSLLSGRLYRAVDYVNAQEVRKQLREDLDRLFEDVDVLATPTAVLEAPERGVSMITTDEGEVEVLEALVRCTAPFNLTGHPALSVPCGLGADGLPVGLQLVGPWYAEELIVDVATTFRNAQDRRGLFLPVARDLR